MKSLRPTLFLLLITLLGGAYLFFAERDPAPREGALVLLRAPQNGVQIVQFFPSKLKLQRRNNGWRIEKTSGLSAPADPDSVRHLLDALQLVQSNAPVANPERFSVYGLEKPRAKLEVDGQTLEFGSSPRFDSRRVYARSQAGIALLDHTLVDFSVRPFESWRDRALWRGEPEKISRITLRTPQLRAVFSKNAATWNIEKPLRTRADGATLSAVLTALQSLRISRWLDESGAKPLQSGLNPPRTTLELGTFPQNATTDFRLEIGAPQGAGFAARTSASPAIFWLPKPLYALLNRPLDTWRDHRVAIFDATSITRIEVERRGAHAALSATGEDWRLDNGPAAPQIRSSALDVLDFLRALRAKNFVDNIQSEPQLGLNAPILSLKLIAKNGTVVSDVRFGRAQGHIYAENNSDRINQSNRGIVFVLNSDALAPVQSALSKIFP